MKNKIIFGSMAAVFGLGFVFFQNYWVHDGLGNWTTIYDIKNQVSYVNRIASGMDCDYRIIRLMDPSNPDVVGYFKAESAFTTFLPRMGGGTVRQITLTFGKSLSRWFSFSNGVLPADGQLVYGINDSSNFTNIDYIASNGVLTGPTGGPSGMVGLGTYGMLVSAPPMFPGAPSSALTPKPAYVQARCHKFRWEEPTVANSVK